MTQAYFELDMTTSTVQVQIDDDGTTSEMEIRTPNFGGAFIAKWGQQDDQGDTMIVWLQADSAEIAKLPQDRRR